MTCTVAADTKAEKEQIPEEISLLGVDDDKPKDIWNRYTKTDVLILVLKLVLFLILWALFIEIQFGAVFLAVAGIVFICYNTRKKSKADKSPSAYSVFNENCERLDGQFTAEQFEQQLRGGFVVR